MNIGIMTFHWAANHGALLQTYALQKALNRLIPGCAVTVVDYKPGRYDMNLKRTLHSRSLKAIRNNLKDIRKESILAPFRETFSKTYRYYSNQQLMRRPPNCDVFIAGSDQIWNEFYTMKGEGGKTPAYYLPFHPGAKHISYAASFGTTELKQEMKEYILPYLQKLDAVSVREQTGKAMLEQMGIDCRVVCDPSALMSREEYHELAQDVFRGNYVAKYFLRGESDEIKKAVKRVRGRETVRDISLLPMERWLGGIEQANFLLTNSFHGMMAAIKLHTPFAIFLAAGALSGMNDRFFTLLDLLNLRDRIVSEENPVEQIAAKQICWDQVDHLMEAYVAESEQFLKENCTPNEKRGPITLYRNAECCGCTACQTVCPKKCISMTADQEGFLYPEIDEAACIKCGKCKQVCPVKKSPVADNGRRAEKAFVARAKDDQVVAASSSGGVFTLLARQIVSSGGVVFAVAMSEDCRSAVYQMAETEEQLADMRGSKYIQSHKGDVFLEVKQELDAGREVLFCGTPCDVNGLYNYLTKTNTNCDKLLLVDFICHGTPSPLVWKKYVSECETVVRSSAVDARFRNKAEGWRKYSLEILFENGSRLIRSREKDPFLRGFCSDLYLRPACHECAAKGWDRLSDFTIADAWGIEYYSAKLADDKGASLVLVNSNKAVGLFAQLSEQMWFAEVVPEQAIEYNSAMLKAPSANANRAAFMGQLPNAKNVDKLIIKYCADPLVLRIKRKVKCLLRGVSWGSMRK